MLGLGHEPAGFFEHARYTFACGVSRHFPPNGSTARVYETWRPLASER